MNYLQRNRSRHYFKKSLLILLGIFVICALVFSFFGGVIVSFISPLWQAENAATARIFGIEEYFRFQKSLMDENQRLRDKVLSLELSIASRPSRTLEISEMLEIMGRELERGGIASTVLVRPPQTPYDSMVIDAGSKEGVSLGSEVFMPEGALLGTVTEVHFSTSRVRLFTTSGERTAAVLERHGIPVTLEGIGGGNFRIVIPREVEVEVGDRILSADISSRLVGIVGDVKMETTDSFKEVLAKSPMSVFNIHYVLVRQ
jgi:cell shape-determining protein MreC